MIEQIAAATLFLIHLTGCAMALHALGRPHSPQGTIAWILGLTLLPILSIPLYIVLGAGRIHRHTTSRHSHGQLQKFLKQHSAWSPPRTRLSQMLVRATGYAPCEGNNVRLLCNGNDTYRELKQAIEAARESILLEFFIIRNDLVGSSLRRSLEERAKAGVAVYVIYDEVGCHKLPAGYLRSLRNAGVKVASFNGKRFWLSSILRINLRNHRKLVVIDSRQAFLGSLNIGIEYTQRPGTPGWRDTFVALSGPVVTQCLLSFIDDWRRATGGNLAHLCKPCTHTGTHRSQLIPSGPDDGPMNAWQLCLLEMAAQARERLWLASPYFVPTESVSSALQAAALRGVDVRVIIPRRGDNMAADLAMLTYIPGMLASGVKILAYEPGFLHEKVCVADDCTSSIGTANLDERSLRLNYELTLLTDSPETCAQVSRMLEDDMKQTHSLTPAHWYRISPLTRLLANCCRLLSPAL